MTSAPNSPDDYRNHGGIVVANPGGISWMIRSAAALAAHGELAAYCSPAVFSDAELRRLERLAPRFFARLIVRQLHLRSVPDTVPAERIVRAATPTEIAYVMALRLGIPTQLTSAFDHRQAVAFDRAVSKVVHRGANAVIGYQGTTTKTFRTAGASGIPRILDYPIAHYDSVEPLLTEELRRVPAYAATMQGARYERWRKDRYQREIAMAERIIMVSSYQQRTFEAAGVEPEQMFMAHFGVDLDLFSPGPACEDGPFRVLFCGQISQRKGISYLVDGFKKAELADAELLFVGRPVGTRHPWIDEPRVRHLGVLPRPQLPDIYRSANVTVLPSLVEGFPSTPLEGMACGVPTIVSEHTFANDVVEDGVDGWVIPIRDSDAIAAHLRALYDDRGLNRRMGAAARKKAAQFPWSRYGDALRAGIAPLLGN